MEFDVRIGPVGLESHGSICPSDAEVEVLDGPVFKLDDRMYLPSKGERCEVW